MSGPRDKKPEVAGADPGVLALDETVHQRTRLAIVSMLIEVRKADFASLRDGLGLTDGNLARHLQVLEQAGLVHSTKEARDNRVRTWVAITRRGRAAYDEEIRQLRELVARADLRSVATGLSSPPAALGLEATP